MLSGQGQNWVPRATGVLLSFCYACTLGDEPEPITGQRSQAATSFEAKLKGRLDTVAEFLRDQPVDAKGQLQMDYQALLEGLAKQESCAPETIRTFIISDDLVTGPAKRERRTEGPASFPRLIGTACASQPGTARNFFVAASFKEPFAFDVDVKNLEMFSWDPEARINRFYTMTPAKDDLVAVTIDPKECPTCHLTPSNLTSDHMPMTPIMNELRRPWSHWRANSEFSGEVSFESHHFELPKGLDQAPNFSKIEEESAGAAKNLEDIIESAQIRVVTERLKDRTLGPGLSTAEKLSQTMALLRPVFCDEQVNYISEDFDSGIYQMSAAVNPGLAPLFRIVLGPNKVTWTWANQDTFRVENSNGKPVDLLPVRGNVNVLYETRLAQLQSDRIIPPEDILRVRALDWGQSALSDFRCDLYKSAEKRFKTPANRPKLTGLKTVAAAGQIVFDEIMTLKVGTKKKQTLLQGDRQREVLAIFDASQATLTALHKAITDDAVGVGISSCQSDGFCVLDLTSWGNQIEEGLRTLTQSPKAHQTLKDSRCRRVLKVLAAYPNRPALPLKEIFPKGNQSCP